MALTDDTHAEGVFEAWLKESAIGSIPLSDPEGRGEKPTWMLLVAGAIAGMVSRTLTAPADRIKTLLQGMWGLTVVIWNFMQPSVIWRLSFICSI